MLILSYKGENIEYAAAQDMKFCLKPSSFIRLFAFGVQYCDFLCMYFLLMMCSQVFILSVTMSFRMTACLEHNTFLEPAFF